MVTFQVQSHWVMLAPSSRVWNLLLKMEKSLIFCRTRRRCLSKTAWYRWRCASFRRSRTCTWPFTYFSIWHHLFNTLFDENASNHLALGSAYAFSVKGGTEMSDEELAEAGLNRSQTHVDFMVGSDKMDIDGIREDGSTVPIFRNGDWAWVYFRTHAK